MKLKHVFFLESAGQLRFIILKKGGDPPPKGLQKRRDCNTPQNKTLSTLLKNATGPKLDQTPETQTGLAEITNL